MVFNYEERPLIETEIIFFGHVPSEKNSKRIVWIDGRPSIASSEAYERWEADELPTLVGTLVLYPPYKIVLTIFSGTLRAEDNGNKSESIHDLLVHAGIIEDDNWFGLVETTQKFGGVDIVNPRIEVVITSADEAVTIAELKAPLILVVKAQRKEISKNKRRQKKGFL